MARMARIARITPSPVISIKYSRIHLVLSPHLWQHQAPPKAPPLQAPPPSSCIPACGLAAPRCTRDPWTSTHTLWGLAMFHTSPKRVSRCDLEMGVWFHALCSLCSGGFIFLSLEELPTEPRLWGEVRGGIVMSGVCLLLHLLCPPLSFSPCLLLLPSSTPSPVIVLPFCSSLVPPLPFPSLPSLCHLYYP